MVEIFKQVSDIDRRAKLPGLPESAQAPGVLTLAKGFELSAENRAYLEARDDKFIASAQLSGQLENAPKEVRDRRSDPCPTHTSVQVLITSSAKNRSKGHF